MSLDRTLVTDDALTIESSVSETETERRNYKKLNMIKMERRAKNREKLMAMKRFSGFLKRPEILGTWQKKYRQGFYITSLSETVYSVEEEEKQKSEEKPDEDPAVTSTDDNEDKTCRDALTRTQEADSADTEKVAEREDDIETTEYDISTDDDSLRMIYSSTDQVTPQNVNQEIKKIRFFVAGLITDWFILLHSSLLLSQLCHNHIAQHEIRMINKHNKALDFLVKSTAYHR